MKNVPFVNIVLAKNISTDAMLDTGSSQNILNKQLIDKLNRSKLIL